MPYRQPWCGYAGDHLCQHPAYLASPLGVAGVRRTVSAGQVLRVWEQHQSQHGAGMAHESTRESASGIPGLEPWGGSSSVPSMPAGDQNATVKGAGITGQNTGQVGEAARNGCPNGWTVMRYDKKEH